MSDWISGKASLILIPIIAGTVFALAAVMATSIWLLGSWAEGRFLPRGLFLDLLVVFSSIGGLYGIYAFIESAVEAPGSWLGKAASGIFSTSVLVLMFAGFAFAVKGMLFLFHQNFTAFVALLIIIAYAMCFWVLSSQAKRAGERRAKIQAGPKS